MFDFLIFISLAINTILGIGVLLRNPRAKIHRLFAIFVVLLNLWILSNYLQNKPGIGRIENLELFLRFDFVFAIFVFLIWFHFSAALAKWELKGRWSGFLIWLLWIWGILFAALALFTPFVLTNVIFRERVIHFDAGVLWPLYAVLLFVLITEGLIFLVLGRRHTKAQKDYIRHQQIHFLLFGFLISVGNAVFINLILRTVYPISLEVSRFGLQGMTLLVALSAYVIIRGRLFDLKLVIVRAIGFLFLTALVALLYAAVLFLGAQFLLESSIDTAVITFAIIVTAIVALSFEYLRMGLAKLTDRIFFKHRYTPEVLLSKLTHIMAATIDIDKMIERILDTLTKDMRLTKAALLIVDNHKIIDMKAVGYADHEFVSPVFETVFREALPESGGFMFEELAEGELKKIFRRLGVTVAMPIRVEKEEVAILILGSKLSGEGYYKSDIDVLSIFAQEAGIAIQNAKSYQEIKQSSEKLEKRVFERTALLEEAQQRELAKAREIARLKDEFVFLAAHELRTPVTAIRGFLELVGMSKKNFPKDVREHLDAISSASNHLGQLINDLLEVARSEAGTIKIEFQAVDLVSIIRSVIKELTPLAKKKKIRITLDAEATIPFVLGDSVRVKEVSMNLLANAIKYNRDKGTVDITVLLQKEEVVVEFRDTGYGIPKEDQKEIFQKFFRAGGKATQATIGTGLGLVITRMLVEKMGGRIMFSSVEGEGSTFAFSLFRTKQK